MAARKVILTERELTSLIRRIIRETEEMDSNKDASKQDVTKALASFFKELKNLKNSSLNFSYFLKHYFSQFQTPLLIVFLAAQERL
jgi:hypothetical protein